MWRIFLIFVLAFSLFPIQTKAETVKAAFIREGNIWLKIGEIEKQITTKGNVSLPQWSHDGEWLAYVRNGLWAYNLKSEKSYRVYHSDVGFAWAPDKNVIAFNDRGVLNVSNLEDLANRGFRNVSLGVDGFSWLPDGTGFLVSTMGNLTPTGWSDIKLFKISLEGNMDFAKAKHFYTIQVDENNFFAIGTSRFKWSPDGKWIAFIGIPTASWSMDSNSLAVLSSDGKNFMELGHMLQYEDWFKWAPSKNLLAFIEGTGRFAVENKHLKVKELPAAQIPSYTPKGYIDRGFTWHNNQLITVSRAIESEWSNNPKKRPMPFLAQVDIITNKQQTLTKPPKGYGDYKPVYIKSANKLFWIRSNRKEANVWVSEPDGSNSKIWIENIGSKDIPVDWYTADDVIEFYEEE